MSGHKDSFNQGQNPFHNNMPDGHKAKTKASYDPNFIYNEQSHDQRMDDGTEQQPQSPPRGSGSQPQDNVNLVSTAISHIAKFLRSKKDVYAVLAYKAQLFLPPYALCTMEFMGQILQRKKHVFQMFEVCHVHVPHRVQKYLTIKVLLEKLKTQTLALQYLPDSPEDHVTKEYLYTVVNTLDTKFFQSVEEEIERHIAKQAQKKKPVEIQIDSSMLQLIEQFTASRKGSHQTISIGGIVSKGRKRTRKQVERDWEITTKIQASLQRQDQHRRQYGKFGSQSKRHL